MKVLLVGLCLLMVLFSGGCVVAFGSGGGIVGLIPLGVLVLNGLILAAIFGWATPAPGVFYTLTVMDFIVATGLLIATLGFGMSDQSILVLGLVLAGGFALKGVLTLSYIRSNRP
jgi:hypothetical protein